MLAQSPLHASKDIENVTSVLGMTVRLTSVYFEIIFQGDLSWMAVNSVCFVCFSMFRLKFPVSTGLQV